MKRIKNKRSFFTGVITIVIAGVCFGTLLFSSFEPRLLIAGMIALAWSISSFILAFSQKGIVEELETVADERDKHIAMKSGHKTLQIINYVLCACCVVSLVLYGVFRLSVFISIATTLCCVLLLLFITMLCVNTYYEKHN